MNEHYPFQLPPLPYAYDALEPYMDAETVMLHHDKHFQTYVTNLNKALEPCPKYHRWSLTRLIVDNQLLPEKIRLDVWKNAGGVYNHTLFFETMAPPRLQKPEPYPITAKAIDDCFGSFDAFQAELKQAGLDRFGSGYAWLCADRIGKLCIISTANQDTPLPQGLEPLLPPDVWEHAYYLKYHNLRGDYLDSWFHLINWCEVEWRYAKFLEHLPCRRPREMRRRCCM